MRETALAPARAVFALVRLITVLHEKSLVRLKFLNILPVVLQVSYKTVSYNKKACTGNLRFIHFIIGILIDILILTENVVLIWFQLII